MLIHRDSVSQWLQIHQYVCNRLLNVALTMNLKLIGRILGLGANAIQVTTGRHLAVIR